MKPEGSTFRLHLKLLFLSEVEVSGIPGVAVKCVEIRRNIGGEGGLLAFTDAEARKRGEQTGLDTLVVHAVTMITRCGGIDPFRAAVNTISNPPGEYDRKVETQRN